MKNITIILILLSTAYGFGQARNHKKKTNQMTISEIKKSFPYYKMETIRLVSFKYDYPVVKASDTTEAPVPAYQPEIPKTNGQIDMAKMFEVKTLDDEGEIELMKILMNYDHQDTNSVAFCYDPRNGIVFFDKDQRILGYIEICFECLRYKTDPSTITVTTLFPDEFEAMKLFFKRAGITYGTSDAADK